MPFELKFETVLGSKGKAGLRFPILQPLMKAGLRLRMTRIKFSRVPTVEVKSYGLPVSEA